VVDGTTVQDGTLRRGLRFGGVGLLVTALHALMQWGWCNGIGAPPWLGYLLALTVSFAVSFTLHYRVTFRSHVPVRTALPAFLFLQVGQQAANYLLFLLFHRLLDGGPHSHLVALALSCTVVAVLSFIGANRIFRRG
jgi:putative flippase GtrA